MWWVARNQNLLMIDNAEFDFKICLINQNGWPSNTSNKIWLNIFAKFESIPDIKEPIRPAGGYGSISWCSPISSFGGSVMDGVWYVQIIFNCKL